MLRSSCLLILPMFALLGAGASGRSADAELHVVALTVRTCEEFTARYHGKILAVRISGIDCPAAKQRYAAEAKAFVSRLVNGQPITVKRLGHDRQRRVWGDVFLSDGRSLAYEMVKAGWARVSAGLINEGLIDLEEDARRAKRGVWQDP